VYNSAAQHLHDEYSTDITAADVKHIMKTARNKKRRRKATEKQSASRAAAREQECQQWEETTNSAKTRGQRRLFTSTQREPQRLSGISRAASS
jgi:hypothetical protein